MAAPLASATASVAAESTGTTISRRDVESLIRQVISPQLYNRQLSSICQVNGLKSTGVKADLQRRITDLVREAVTVDDAARFHQIRQSVVNAMGKRSSPQKPAPGRTSGLAATNGSLGSSAHSQTYPHGIYPGSSAATSTLTFKPSPFYRMESQISGVQTCPAMQQHRSSIHLILRLNDIPSLQLCIDDPSYRVMIFCAAEGSGPQDIAFPHQSELKVNGGDFKANLRGLKNKPGSTRPVDITSVLRLKPAYTNNVEFTYALTQKRFQLVAYVCQYKAPEVLAKEVATRRKIPKDSVIAELNKKAQDPDVVATSQKLSLKCPLTYMRLDVPCRSINCTHIQCFDATSYLQLQEQGPQWLCPICNKQAQYDHLAVDEYVRDILDNTPKSLENVTIEPNGQWSTKSVEQNKSYSTKATPFDDDGDEVEICEVTVTGRRLDMAKFPTPASSTPGPAPRPSSAAPRGLATHSGKRPISQVIDLTLDSDEDKDVDEDDRPAKRQKHNTGTSKCISHTSDGLDSLGFLSETPPAYP